MKNLKIMSALVVLISLGSFAIAADKDSKEIRGVIASISQPDDKGVVTITVMDGSRKDRHVVTVTADSNTKIVEKKKTRDLKALEDHQEVKVTGEQPATQIEILARKVKRE